MDPTRVESSPPLTRELPTACFLFLFFVYVDDIAVITPHKAIMRGVAPHA